MKNSMIWVAIAAMMMMAMPSCSSENENEPENGMENGNGSGNQDNTLIPIKLTRQQQQMVNENNDFAFNLFRTATQVDPSNPSLILSPISITYTLGMLNNGATGETQRQINTVLGFAQTGADSINAFCKKMMAEAPKLDKMTKVMIANNIYLNKGYKLFPDFVKTANDCYNAQPETRDFADGKTCDVINKWGSDHTEGMIKEVLNKSEFNPMAVSYLLNAIYFKGTWSSKFIKSETKDEAFEGRNQKVPMMHQKSQFNYKEDNLCKALILPYGNKAYTMTILLPQEGKSVDEVLTSLTAESWKRYLYMGSALVDVKLPRFETNTNMNLNEIMASLGMPKAFTALAEFDKFCNVPTKIGFMKQVARIKLDEEGSEAAAVTVIGLEKATAEPQEPTMVEFHATRPFLYVISEQSTGAIFFIGKYMGE